MEQLNLFDVFKDLNNTKSETKNVSENVDCEFYKQGKCHAIETRAEPCIRCWLCQK